MSHANEKIRNYCCLNRGILILLLVCLAWPLVTWFLMQVFPAGLQTCTSISFFNRPCPMCGLTRGFLQLIQGNLTAAQAFNPLTIPLTILLLLEITIRTVIISKSAAWAFPARLPRLDMLMHAILVAAYFVYALIFIVLTW